MNRWGPELVARPLYLCQLILPQKSWQSFPRLVDGRRTLPAWLAELAVSHLKTRQVQARCAPNHGQEPPAGEAGARLTRVEL